MWKAHAHAPYRLEPPQHAPVPRNLRPPVQIDVEVAAWADEPGHLAQRRLGVGQMVEDPDRHDDVEGALLEWQALDVRLNRQRGVREVAAGDVDGIAEVDCDDVRAVSRRLSAVA